MRIFEYATGEVGLKPQEFYCLTYYEYTCILAGFILRNAKEWDRTRTIAFWIWKVQTTDKTTTIQQFMPLSIDKKDEVKIKQTTDEEKQKLSNIAMDRIAMFGDKIKKT